MKKMIYILSAFVLLIVGCELDNYEPPKSMLTGRLVYEGAPIGIRQGINVLQLYEPGWQTSEPISVGVKQDGSFSALLFNGTYKLVPIEGNSPFIVSNRDTITIEVKGKQTMIDVPVVPYFITHGETFQTSESSLTAVFNIDKVFEGATLDKVGLFVGKNLLVDDKFNIGKSQLSVVDNLNEPITINVNLSDIKEDYVFARIGVKAKQSAEYAFSQVQKIQINK